MEPQCYEEYIFVPVMHDLYNRIAKDGKPWTKALIDYLDMYYELEDYELTGGGCTGDLSFAILEIDLDTDLLDTLTPDFSEDQVLAVLVTASPVLPGAKAFGKRVRQLCPKITTFIQNINERSTSAVLGYKEKILYGKGYIQDTLCGIRFRISGSSFYQINPVQTEILYRTAIEAAELDKNQTVLDAYCGVGTIGLSAASRAKKVIGVERNKSAVRCAWENAKENGIQNVRFLCADATDFIRKMAARGERVDVVFMDPPRAGSTPEFLQAVSAMRPEKIVYVSCNPETQKRDLELLTKEGWQVKLIQGVDMFPHTEGIETVVSLERK